MMAGLEEVQYCDADEKVLDVVVVVGNETDRSTCMLNVCSLYFHSEEQVPQILIANTDHFCTPSPTIRSTRKSGGQIWAEGGML